jgi:hypothetical protein
MPEKFGVYINQTQQQTGSKTKMLQAAKKIVKGHVAVWKLDAEGKRVGRRPVYRTFDAVEK